MAAHVRFTDGISIRTFIHATESIEKVLDALETLLPKNDQNAVISFPKYDLQDLTGHFKNPLKSLTIDFKKRQIIKKILSNLGTTIPSVSLNKIKHTLKQRIEKDKYLYIRLDKQEMTQGILDINNKGDVQVIITIVNKNPRSNLTEEAPSGTTYELDNSKRVPLHSVFHLMTKTKFESRDTF